MAIAVVVTLLLVNRDKDEGYRVIKIKSFENEVTLTRDGEGVKVFDGLSLNTKDTVATGKNSSAGLVADSDKHIMASENTCFDVISSGSEKSGKIQIDINYGTVLFDIENKLPKDSEFVVKTPNASLSVRGTSFEVSYDKQSNTTKIDVINGIVEVEAKDEAKDLYFGGTAVIKDDAIESFDNPNEGKTELFRIASKEPSGIDLSFSSYMDMTYTDGNTTGVVLSKRSTQKWKLYKLEGWEVEEVITTTTASTTTPTTTTSIDENGNVIYGTYANKRTPVEIVDTISKDGVEIKLSTLARTTEDGEILEDRYDTTTNADGDVVCVDKKNEGSFTLYRRINVYEYGMERIEPEVDTSYIREVDIGYIRINVLLTTDEALELYGDKPEAFVELTRDKYYEVENIKH